MSFEFKPHNLDKEEITTLLESQLNTSKFLLEDKAYSAQQFLLNLFVPKPSPIPHQTFVNFDLPEMKTIEDIKEVELAIFNMVLKGKMSLEVQEKLLSATERMRMTFANVIHMKGC